MNEKVYGNMHVTDKSQKLLLEAVLSPTFQSTVEIPIRTSGKSPFQPSRLSRVDEAPPAFFKSPSSEN